MITDNCQEDQLLINSDEFFKFEIKICQKDRCGEVCIPRGKYCEEHKTKPVRKCEHGKRKTYCKKCEGGSICEHNRIKSKCKKCDGTEICEHGKQRSQCKDCNGSSICEHNIQRAKCKKCVGISICDHGKQISQCKECGGGSICEHDKIRSYCKECGGSAFCEHGKQKSRCKECKGSAFCEHNKRKSICKECNFIGYLSSIVRSRIFNALTYDKELRSEEYLGCDIETFKIHIEKQFKDGMSWENHGEWHIDHIIPIKYKEDDEPILEEVIKRLHYTNTQPLWAKENISKGNKYIG